MKLPSRSLLTAGLLAAAVLPAQAKIERTVEKTFTVRPGGTLIATTSGGNITLQPSGDSVVRVVAVERISADTEAEADDLLKDFTLTIGQQGNDVSAVARSEGEPHAFHFGSWPKVRVDFIITVPARYAADVGTSGGNIAIGDLDGTVKARTSGGHIKLGRISSDIDARTSGGNVSLAEGGANVKLDTSGGNIRAGRMAGAADLATSGGDIEAGTVENTLRARTSGGNVTAEFKGPIKGDCLLDTSGGFIKAVVEAKAAFVLDASTSGGSVRADGLTIEIANGGLRRSRLKGAVNGGGPTLKLRSSGGDIEVQTL